MIGLKDQLIGLLVIGQFVIGGSVIGQLDKQITIILNEPVTNFNIFTTATTSLKDQIFKQNHKIIKQFMPFTSYLSFLRSSESVTSDFVNHSHTCQLSRIQNESPGLPYG